MSFVLAPKVIHIMPTNRGEKAKVNDIALIKYEGTMLTKIEKLKPKARNTQI